MPKIYAKSFTKMDTLQPKTETLNFILNYSKALHVIQLKNMQVAVLKN